MKKYNNLLMVGLFSLVMGSLIASEGTKPSLVESTKKDLKIASILYTAVYSSLHIVGGTGVPLLDATMKADFDRYMAKQKGEKIPFKTTVHTFGKELKDSFFSVNKGIIRSHLVVAPAVVIGVVAHICIKKVNS